MRSGRTFTLRPIAINSCGRAAHISFIWLRAMGLVLALPAAARAQDRGWVCPSQCPGNDDTAKVQHAFDSYDRVYLDRDYDVSSVAIHRLGQHVAFRGHSLNGVHEDPNAEACLHISGRNLTLRDVRVSARYGYQAAVRWHSVSRRTPAQYNKVFGMHIMRARVGLLFGVFSSPVDAPQSENAIFGVTFRGVQTCVHVNQPNGFLYIVNSVIDCNPYEWRRDKPDQFDDTAARAMVIEHGQVEVANSELLKTSTQKGYLLEIGARGVLKAANCHFESGAAACLLRGQFWASNLSGLINSDSVPVLDLPADAVGPFSAWSNCRIRRKLAVSRYSGMWFVRSKPQTKYRVAFSNCALDGWKPRYLSSGGVKCSAKQIYYRYVTAERKIEEEFVE